jgi:NADH:ubiquinone oxidoreductase subunit 5 (subunit L)/multisubunit Na+/H+ antiporter MnhA subunit
MERFALKDVIFCNFGKPYLPRDAKRRLEGLMTLASLALLPPLLVALVALRNPGPRPAGVPQWAEWGALAALVLALAGLVWPVTLMPGGLFAGDLLARVLAVQVAFIGWVVVRYSRTYLDGDAGEGRFHARLLATIAAALALAQAGNIVVLVLAFVAVGEGVRRLLLTYADRPQAQRAAAKFALVWRGGDLALALAAVLLVWAYGTTDIGAMRAAAAAGVVPHAAVAAVALIVVTALMKVASFPLHGWLTEVMEAPTPVSALLHAGVINAGGVLLLRMSDLVQASPLAMAALVLVGGFTALFGALVMLTQPAVKTALAWSTVGQMGFMILQCGLGLWALALLHIVAHGLYKAHAFLASGNAVAAVDANRRPGPVAVPGMKGVLASFAIAVALYFLAAAAFGFAFGPKSPQALALGAMLVFGVAYLVAQGLADAAPAELTRRVTLAAGAAAVAYFAFQAGADWLMRGTLPAAPVAGPLEWALIVLTVASFGAVALAQALFPHWAHHPASAGLRVHLANGLYVNAAFDRVIGGFRAARS